MEDTSKTDTPSTAVAGSVDMPVAGPLYPVWFAQIGHRLLQLGRASPGSLQ